MERFYYKRLVAAGLVHCDVFLDGEIVAGFLSYTEHPDLGGVLLKKEGVAFAMAMAGSLLSDPRRLGVLFNLMSFSRLRAATDPPDSTGRGELLTLAIGADYRTPEFRQRSNRRISLELLRSGIRALGAKGLTRFTTYVEAENAPMLRIYEGLGCALTRIPRTPTVRVEGQVAAALAFLDQKLGA